MVTWLWKRLRPACAPRARLCLETLEDRAVPSAATPDAAAGRADLGRPAGPAVATVYVESNNPAPGQNAVLAFRRNPADGSLRQIGMFPTGGTGQLNLPKVVGPDDGDQQVE